MKVQSLIGVSLALGLVAGAPQTSFAQQKAAPRFNTDAVVRFATPSIPNSSDPHRQPTSGQGTFLNPVFDRMTRVNERAEVVPMLATSWSVSADGSTMEFKLRKDVKFHDGTPFDAAAVKANIERGKTLPGSTVNAQLESIRSVEVVDQYTVRMLLAPGRGAEVPALLATTAGMMMSPKAMTDSSRNFMINPGNAGSGPYVIAEVEPRSRLFLERVPGKHWDAEGGKLKRIEMTYIAVTASRVNAVRAGQFEMSQIIGNDILTAKQIVAASGGAFRGLSTTPPNQIALHLRSDRIPDPRIRKAISLAVNRGAIADGLLKGVCTATMQPYPKTHWAHSAGINLPYDPARAKALLKEAGASDYRMDIGVGTGSTGEATATALQSQLADVGIRATITAGPQAEAVASFQRGEREAYVTTLQAVSEPSVMVDEVFVTRYKVLPAVPAAEFNQFKELAAKALSPRLKQAQRGEAYAQLWKLNAERAYVIPICFSESYWITSSKVGGLEPILDRGNAQGGGNPDFRFLYVTQ